MTDGELANQAQNGNADAFVALIHRYHLPLYRLAYRFAGSSESAEDLCQEILIRAFRQIGKFDIRRPFQPWLMRVASNVSLNWRESEVRRREAETELTEELHLPAGGDTEKEALDRIDRRDLLEALHALPKDIRLVVIMRLTLGLTFREISEQTGIKLPTVAHRVTKGIESLRAVLSPESEVYEL